MVKRIIVVNADGTPYHEGDVVPETVRAQVLRGPDKFVSLNEALGPTLEEKAERLAKFQEFLAAKATKVAEGNEGE